MQRNIVRILVLCFCLIGLLSGLPQLGYADSLHVSAHTAGEISRVSTIQVEFSQDVVDAAQIGQALAKSPVTFEPVIAGSAVWKDLRTLEFRPESHLLAGQEYLATINLSGFLPSFLTFQSFTFSFTAMRQAFDVTLDGLQATDPQDSKILQLTGKVTTADVESAENIAKFLTATHVGKSLEITWTHAENRREHSFIVHGIVRGNVESTLVVAWDGNAIAVEKKGESSVTIPADGVFQVLKIRPVFGAEQYVEVQFSDPLQKDQDLNGLIRITNSSVLRFAIVRNMVRVYVGDRGDHKVTVTIDTAIRNQLGVALDAPYTQEVNLEETKPQVRFVGKGVILPTTQGLTLPIETVNLNEVIVQATQIFDQNVAQFLQVNTLETGKELQRVGRRVWQDVIALDTPPDKRGEWLRYGLDVSPLLQNFPGGIYRIQLSFRRPHVTYSCPPPCEGDAAEEPFTLTPESDDWEQQARQQAQEDEDSYWDYYEDYYEEYYDAYENRKNPCHPGYYRKFDDHDITVARNVLISDIGLMAKIGANDEIAVVVTDLKTAQPLPGVELSVLDYQQQVQAMGKSDSDGMAVLRSERKPFLIAARRGAQAGFLKLDTNSALSVSHFDVAGQTVQKGLKGFLYGERGVWRPGDPIYLTFILFDPAHELPAEHPVLFELRNPKGQLVHTLKKKESVNGFYTFITETSPEAPTGNWTARVMVGGATFEKVLKIEMVMPNRLKIKLDFGEDVKSLQSGTFTANMSAAWLHGAIAEYLDADVKVSFGDASTQFPRYADFNFTDPVRQYTPEVQTIFEGQLDDEGNAAIDSHIEAENVSPGMLTAYFTTRVFEPGGAFSVDRFSLPYHPYPHYVGLQLPQGDKRGMLLTDTPHIAKVALLDPDGNPVSSGKVEMKLYELKWRWWWDKGADNLNYVQSSSYKVRRHGVIEVKDGYGEWEFQENYPEWGRYLVRACDLDGNHCTGQIVYIDWPGWAGRAQNEDMPGGASVLNFSADKEAYMVGENVVLTIPTSQTGRGLLSIESGSRVIHAQWFEPGDGETTLVEFKATADMAPNVYAHVTLLQPHLQTQNDLPIRLYGIIPIPVEDPQTRLRPALTTPETFEPETTAQISVNEANGKPMTYTVAIVDEGLLDLTRFKTPNPWSHFYQREALGVKTWDLFDFVVGAYGGTLEKLLAIGGDGDLAKPGEKEPRRFPPMVKFMGPFTLAAGQTNTHDVEIPQYIGSVRVMVVAGQDGAFGATEKAVPVRKAVMTLGTLPRVLGPGEEVEMPISLFTTDDAMKDITVSVTTEGPLTVVGDAEQQLVMEKPGEALITFKLKVEQQTGWAAAIIRIVSGSVTNEQRIDLEVRMPTNTVTNVLDSVLADQQTWQTDVAFPGMAGTNVVKLEVSRIPPLNLEKRLDYLIQYPHGCVEQTTSAVFPQLYLKTLLELPQARQDEIQKNITAGIERLRGFQIASGGFGFWPGDPDAHDWSSNYVGHFLVEAEKVGYLLPPGVLAHWKEYQKTQAQAWMRGEQKTDLIQSYRLYTLALAGAAELGAMNRLREDPQVSTAARWQLAAAYTLAGQKEAAEQLVLKADTTIPEYQELSNTFGTALRDKAIILEALSLMDKASVAKPLVDEISKALSGQAWLSTQTTAYALIAIARHVGAAGASGEKMDFTASWNGGAEQVFSSTYPLVQADFDAVGKLQGTLSLKNTGSGTIYPRLIVSGKPAPGTETAAAKGLALDVKYLTLQGAALDPAELPQGTDFMAKVTVTNTGVTGEYKELALSHLFPSGWEIHNERLDPGQQGAESNFEYQDIRDDRVYTYFSLKQGEAKTFKILLNASYLGKFYLPMVSVEAMYDATINARLPGQWVQIVKKSRSTGANLFDDTGNARILRNAEQQPDSQNQAASTGEVINVSNAEEFLAAIGSNRTIQLEPGTYEFDSMIYIAEVENLSIVGLGQLPVKIIQTSEYNDVLHVSTVKNIRLTNLEAGHQTQGECDADVLNIYDSENITITDTILFGSGVGGLDLDNVTGLTMQNSVIKECSEYMVSASSSTGILLENSDFVNNTIWYAGLHATDNSEITFRRCNLAQNENSEWSNSEGTFLLTVEDGSAVTLRESRIAQNTTAYFAEGQPAEEDCLFEENEFSKGKYLEE